MAGAKEIKKRIQSVKNTRKITRTMEMVATAKSKRMIDRVNAAQPYGEKIAEFMETLGGLKNQVESPLLRNMSEPRNIAVLVVTGNRGLCGGYNSNTLKLARKLIKEYQSRDRNVIIHMIGKKGITFFRFLKFEMAQTHENIDDKFEYADSEAIARDLMDQFARGDIDRLDVVSTVYHNSARQTPEVTRILPVGQEPDVRVGKDDQEKKSVIANVVYEPSPEVILEKLLPLVVKTMIYRALLEAVASEQIARRVAMKSATGAIPAISAGSESSVTVKKIMIV